MKLYKKKYFSSKIRRAPASCQVTLVLLDMKVSSFVGLTSKGNKSLPNSPNCHHMTLCRFLCPAFIGPMQPVASHYSMMRCLMSRTTPMSDHISFSMITRGVWMTAGVWFDWPMMAALGTFSGLWGIVCSGSMTLGNLSTVLVLLKYTEWHISIFSPSLKTFLRHSQSVLRPPQLYVFPKQHWLQSALRHTWS